MCRFSTSLLCLAIAWFCTNQPQGFIVELLAWAREAAHFSHQGHLVTELRATLAAAGAPVEAKQLASAEREIPLSSPPVAPVSVYSFVKLHLALAGGLELLPPTSHQFEREGEVFAVVGRPRDVPVPVPRMMV